MSLTPDHSPSGVPASHNNLPSRRSLREAANRVDAATPEDPSPKDRKPRSQRTAQKSAPRARVAPRVSVVGVIGELLLTAGVVVLLFLGWQLWLNDVVVRGEQNTAAAELRNQWATENPATPAETPAASDPAASDPPATDAGPAPLLAQPGEAEKFGTLLVPRFGSDYQQILAGGTSPAKVLNDIGIGHYNDTQMPGEAGNFALAGHRNTHGAPLNQVAELRVGDPIVVETAEGWYTYKFRSLEYVKPSQVEVLNPVPQTDQVEATDAIITLTSCNPKLSTAERIIAYGVYDSWTPRSAGPPASLTEQAG